MNTEPDDPHAIITYTRRQVNPFTMSVDDVVLLDIAHSLSFINRFLGHSAHPISVANHSIAVSRLLRAQGHPADVQLAGLMHDASEAYLCDIPSPLKRHPIFRTYRPAEHRVQAVIARAYGLSHLFDPVSGWVQPIKNADHRVYDAERDARFEVRADTFRPPETRSQFIDIAHHLMREHQ